MQILRLFQRYPPRLWILVLFPFSTIIALFLLISGPPYEEYTASSIQSMSDKIKYLTETIDDWRKQSVSRLSELADGISGDGYINGDWIPVNDGREPRAVIMMFAKTMDLFDSLETIRTVEDRFNRQFNYDWMIVTDAKHSENFKRTITSLVSGKISFVSVDKKKHFGNTRTVNSKLLKQTKQKLKEKNVDGKISLKTKTTQRLWTSSLFQIDELKDYDFFMRVTPGLQFQCDVSIDLFKFMKKRSKNYGFALATQNTPNIFETLWPLTLKYISSEPKSIHPNNLIDFISDDDGESFNNCEFETMFEIGYLKFFRSERYIKFIDYLMISNGLFYENWKDSTLRTLAVSLLNDSNNVQLFNIVAMKNFNKDVTKHTTCPYRSSFRLSHNCICDPAEDHTWTSNSCIEKFYKANNAVIPEYFEEHKAFLKEKEQKDKADKDAELLQLQHDEELLRQQTEKMQQELEQQDDEVNAERQREE